MARFGVDNAGTSVTSLAVIVRGVRKTVVVTPARNIFARVIETGRGGSFIGSRISLGDIKIS